MAVFTLGGMTTFALAQALVDPTRPPSMAAAGEPNADSATTTTGPILQSVLISPRRTEAIISGRTVKVGDRIGDARVIRIAENEVVLRSGAGLQTLKIFPDIQKHQNAGRTVTGPQRRP